jgi:putative peptidoglycan lipid II flippase
MEALFVQFVGSESGWWEMVVVAPTSGPVPPEAPVLRIWLACFAYAAVVALIVQVVLLPLVLASFHAGHGLLVGGDALIFHEIAADLAQRIRTEGWSAWQLRPGAAPGQGPAGIAAAVYALSVSEPWTLIPLNAALHATGSLFLLRLVQLIVPDWRRAIWCALPFALYPSAMFWYTQIYKDSYQVTGAVLFVYGWALLARLASGHQDRWTAVRAGLWVVLGSALVWIVRPYALVLLQAVAVLLALLLTAVFLATRSKRRLSWPRAVVGVLLVWGLVIFVSAFPRGDTRMERALVETTALEPSRPLAPLESQRPPLDGGAPGPTAAIGPSEVRPTLASGPAWQATTWLPGLLDSRLRALAVAREGMQSSPHAASDVDREITLRSAGEIVAYVPRALQIGLLAPFPQQWLEPGSREANTWMRRLTGFEMVGVYLGLAFVPYSLWVWRRDPALWVVLVFTGSLLLVHALAIPNVGTLHRMRYPYLMTLVALGLASVGTVRGPVKPLPWPKQ